MPSLVCKTCSKEFHAYPCDVRRGRKKYCSQACASRTHGMSAARIYKIWACMINRCKSDSPKNRKFYKSRGITVCEEWSESFEAFLEWAMANGYKEELTIDRKNSNGNYGPDNCRWATRQQQLCNTRKRQRDGQSSKFKGVFRRDGKWGSSVCFNGTRFYLGRFNTEIQAAKAYDRKAMELFGEFAMTNFAANRRRQGGQRC